MDSPLLLLRNTNARNKNINEEYKTRLHDENERNQNDRATMNTGGLVIASAIPNSKCADDYIPDAISINSSTLDTLSIVSKRNNIILSINYHL